MNQTVCVHNTPDQTECDFKTNTPEVFKFLRENFSRDADPTIADTCAKILENRIRGCHGWSTEDETGGSWMDDVLPVPADAYSFVLQSRYRKPEELVAEAMMSLSVFKIKKPAKYTHLNKMVGFYSELQFSLCSCKDVRHLVIHFSGNKIQSLDILYKQNGRAVLRTREELNTY